MFRGRIARWLLLFLEFDFKVVYKLGKTHHMADALSRLPNGEPPDGNPDQTVDATLFSTEPVWLQQVSTYLTTGLLPLTMSLGDRKRLVLRSLPFTTVNGQLYRLGMDNVLRNASNRMKSTKFCMNCCGAFLRPPPSLQGTRGGKRATSQ